MGGFGLTIKFVLIGQACVNLAARICRMIISGAQAQAMAVHAVEIINLVVKIAMDSYLM